MTWYKTPELRFFTDFNSVGEDGRLFSSRATFSGPLSDLREGVPARVSDHEGNSVQAFIQSVHDRYVTLDPEWETWIGASGYEVIDGGRFSEAVTTAGNRSFELVA